MEETMSLPADCMACILRRQEEGVRQEPDEGKKAEYLGKVRVLLREAACSAPVVTERITRLRAQYFGADLRFVQLKEAYNRMLLERASYVEAQIAASPDPLKQALRFAQAGNYIDFGAMAEISDEKLMALLKDGRSGGLNEKSYRALLEDLSDAKRLVYLTDNCGEIVLDKLLIRVLQRRYPRLTVRVIVRGRPVLNDATLADAEAVGLTALCQVEGNGTGVAGTDLAALAPALRKRIETADLVIAKGQGNFESLHGCGLNIYYLFLCKCDWFVRRFQMKRYEAVFLNERDAQIR